MDELQRQFVTEAQEIVEKLDHDLDELRAFRLVGPKRRELAARIFRRVHTLKGSASSLGLNNISQVAHEFESVLDGVRLGRVAIDEPLLNALEEATNLVAQTLSHPFSPTGRDAHAITSRLHSIASTSLNQSRIASTLRAALPEDIARSLSEYDLQHAREAVREGAKLFVVATSFAITDFDRDFRELSKLLGQSGEVIATVPGEAAKSNEIGFQLLYATDVLTDEIARRAKKLGQVDFNQLSLNYDARPRFESPGPRLPRRASQDSGVSVRVDLERLNELISNASELFRKTTNVLSAIRPIENQDSIEAAIKELRLRFGEFEESLIRLRLVPLAEVLERTAARAGRIAARQLGKEIEFEIVGGDVEVDKTMADAIAEPLMHLVRNAVGHGIETPAERVAAGKNPAGKVRLAAFSEGSRIHISISDDGRGIDLERIASAAAKHGISGHESLSMDQCLRLIFRPGFSTASEVSELSGRGIGLDVVDRAMMQAGGEVRIRTAPGEGTTFLLIMPAALALVDCLIVQSGEQFYAIEQSHVAARLPSSPDELNRQTGTFNWEGSEIALASLRDLLTSEADHAPITGGKILICNTGTRGSEGLRKVALLIDGIVGEHPTLVRNLGRHAARWRGVSGATELTDGTVALVLDLNELLRADRES